MLKTHKKNRLMHITFSLGTGGVEKLVHELAERVNAGLFVSSICCLTKKGRFSKELESRGINVFYLNKKKGVDYSLFFKIANILRREKIDIVHAHDSATNLYASIAARMAGVKVVINTEHGGIYFETTRRKLINKFLCFLDDKMICVSESVKYALMDMGLPTKRLKVIPNSLDFAKFDIEVDRSKKRKEFGLCDSDFVICCVGRLSGIKNHRMLLDSVRPILEKIPEARFLIVGDGPLREFLEEYSKDSGILEKVMFLGTRQDVAEILKISDCFVICSNSESFGLAALEAMAAGIPVISTSAGGLKEIVKNYETGILIAKNDVAGLINAICRIKDNPLIREKIVSNARKMVNDNYAIEGMIKDYENLYLNCYKGLLNQ